tara:strand:- start:46 stop:237 length:192 start_codon:yes stop_codon:yes gene_type:complete
MSEIEIPLIISGENVKSGYHINERYYTYDNAATVAALLGVQRHNAWIGKVIKSAFKAYPEMNE